MKNIEKYAGTKDALEAWNKYHDGGGNMPFSEWAEMEVELPTLLDAAEAMIKAWFSDGIEGTADVIAEKICVLDDVIKREKSKPVRNKDKYMTANEATKGFREMCNGIKYCVDCRFRNVNCGIAWLYEKAVKVEAK